MNGKLPHGKTAAFFYISVYFLLPDSFQNEASFLHAAHSSQGPLTFTATLLNQGDSSAPDDWQSGVCLAPCFIDSSACINEEISIEFPHLIVPAEVEILTQQEYNHRLRALIQNHCPGCEFFSGLDDTDASLSGHFTEITLRGFCPYRQTSQPEFISFNDRLDQLINEWEQHDLHLKPADNVIRALSNCLNLKYHSGAIMDTPTARKLMLHSSKSSVLHTALTDITSNLLQLLSTEEYIIHFSGRYKISQDTVFPLLLEENRAKTQRELKKYGVRLALIQYDPDGQDDILQLLEFYSAQPYIIPLATHHHQTVCLLTGDIALMQLSCAAPLFMHYHATMMLVGPHSVTHHRISHEMESIAPDD